MSVRSIPNASDRSKAKATIETGRYTLEEREMDHFDEAIQRWTERLFLAKELLPSDPKTSVAWQREVVTEIENTLRQSPEELARLRPALIRAREALAEGEAAAARFSQDSQARNRAFHAAEAEHARVGRQG
jgi:hypothetical protein